MTANNVVEEDHKSRIVEVTNDIIDKVRILRLRDVGIENGGFQRALQHSRVVRMVDSLRRNPRMIVPPILLADTGDEFILVDGQHRFEARKRHKYHLYAQVSKMTLNEAVSNFCSVNGTSVRVGIKHRLAIDPGEFAKNCRAMAKKYSLPSNYVYHMLGGLTGNGGYTTDVDAISPYHWEVIDVILKEWSDDSRWKSDAQVYAKPGLLKAIARMAKDVKGDKLIKALRLLKKMNYSKVGGMYDRCGMNYERQRDLRNYINAYLLKEMN